jgi:uncharacterized protein YndB with AHSA1/START domain
MIDVQHQINAVDRTVGSRTLAAGEARVITVTQTYGAGVADVWDACTNPERIPRWFLPVSGDLREGGHYQLEGNASGTIDSCDPPRGFTATWEFGGEVSWIDVRMIGQDDERTTLVLEHVAHVDDTRWTEFGPGAVGVGWDMALMGLATHLAEGTAIDRAEAAAWTTSDDGRWFMVRSSDLWCDASVQAGADPQAAREAADRTTAAYTGVGPESESQVTN